MAKQQDKERRVLELFSGIGGMHSAFKQSGLSGHIVAAIDINTVANTVYAHNHPRTKLLTSNIQKITPQVVRKLRANTILMSPPCQPFTRTGKQQDVADARTNALIHLCEIVGQLEDVDSILMENVKGFETSQARDMYLNALKEAGFFYQEFILSPSQLGIPNTRFRYYCLARKSSRFPYQVDRILEEFPPPPTANSNLPETTINYSPLVKDYLDITAGGDSETDGLTGFLLPDLLLEKRAQVLDIARSDSVRTMCFTKAYTHYTEGTGSVYCPSSKDQIQAAFELVKMARDDPLDDEGWKRLRSLGMRYFTPNEVARLMCFPVDPCDGDDDEQHCFSFPKVTTNRQKYRLLGNSINVYVVSELIRSLFV